MSSQYFKWWQVICDIAHTTVKCRAGVCVYQRDAPATVAYRAFLWKLQHPQVSDEVLIDRISDLLDEREIYMDDEISPYQHMAVMGEIAA